jgi:type IV pilus assembly protein PilF
MMLRKPCLLLASSLLTAMCCASTAAAENAPLSYAAERYIGISQDLMAQGNLAEALSNAEQATRADPKSGLAQVHKAQVLEKMNRLQKATQAYAKALKLSPNDGYVLNAVALNTCANGKAVESDALFVRAVQDLAYQIPQQALQNAGACAYKAGNMALAEQRFRAALSVEPESALSLELMAVIKFKQASFFEARAFMQRREALGALDSTQLQLAHDIEKAAGDDRAATKYKQQLDTILQAQIQAQPPTGEGNR